jgi:hypothetical protein
MRWKTNLLSAALSGVMLLGGITLLGAAAQARDRDSCRDISSEERDLQRNIRHHGYYSRQAEHERREIAQLRARCWGGNRGWGWRDRDDRRGWRHRDRDRDHEDRD